MRKLGHVSAGQMMASPITEVELSQRQGATGRGLGRPMRVDNSLSHQSSRCSAQAAIRGDLVGSNKASAAGIVATGHPPLHGMPSGGCGAARTAAHPQWSHSIPPS